ncbi:NAD(P)/FAD-dependent oxidoreductase [Orrella marina]|nr:FAD-dependent oxidoreductase [Orrella marina]
MTEQDGDQACTRSGNPTGAADVAVIGAGIVGVCTAYELRKRGQRVILIDKAEPGQGCSFGNSGAISPSSVTPLAMPGVLASVPRMLGKPDSPLFLPWWYLPSAAPWLIRFVMAARPHIVRQSAASLARIHTAAVQRHECLAREVGVPELVLRRGHLHLYRDQSALDADHAAWDLRAQHGYTFSRLSRQALQALEPRAPERYKVAMFLEDQATILNPYRYVRAIFAQFLARGGESSRAEVRALRRDGEGLWEIVTDARPIFTRQVVVAAGIWSRALLEPLGIRLHMETQRGYHVQFTHRESPVSRTVILTDHKVFLTPMEDGLRIGGTVEFAGTQAQPNEHRARILLRVAQENFSELVDKPHQTWMGHRPCMPDTVPVMGPADAFVSDNADKLPGLWVATGHGHLGLTDSVGTASLIADGVCSAANSGLKTRAGQAQYG